MFNSRCIFLFLSIFIFLKVSSQKIYKGAIYDNGGKGEGSCTIRISDLANVNSFVSAASNPDGTFSIFIPFHADSILLSISSISSLPFNKKIYLLSTDLKDTVLIDSVSLINKVKILTEVKITANAKTKIYLKGDIVEFIPGKPLLSSQLKATAIFRSLPDVFNIGNEMKIRGQTVQKIFLHTSDTSQGILIDKSTIEKFQAKEIAKVLIYYNDAELHVYLKNSIKSGYAFENNSSATQGNFLFSDISPTFKWQKNSLNFKLYSSIGNDLRKLSSQNNFKSAISSNLSDYFMGYSDINSNKRYFTNYFILEKGLPNGLVIGLQGDITFELNKLSGSAKNVSTDYGVTSQINQKDKRTLVTPNLYFKKTIDSGKLVISGNTGFTCSSETNNNDNLFIYDNAGIYSNGNNYLLQTLYPTIYFAQFEFLKKTSKTGTIKIGINYNLFNSRINNSFTQNTLTSSTADSNFINKIDESKIRLTVNHSYNFKNKNALSVSAELFLYKYQNKSIDTSTNIKNNFTRALFGINYSIFLKNSKYLSVFFSDKYKAPNYQSFIFSKNSVDGLTANSNNPSLLPYQTLQTGVSYPLLKYLIVSAYWNKYINKIFHYPDFDQNVSSPYFSAIIN